MVNAWLMYKEVQNLDTSILEFCKSVAYGLCDARPPAKEVEVDTPSRNRRPRLEMAQREVQKRKPCHMCYEAAKKNLGWRVARNLKGIRTYGKGCEEELCVCIDCFNKKHRYGTE
jgi:hypothetical protein